MSNYGLATDTNSRSYLSRPDGKVAVFGLPGIVLAILGVIFFLYAPVILAFIALVLTETLYCIILAAILAVVVGPLFVKQNRVALLLLYKGMCKSMTNMVVAVDPITIMLGYQATAREQQRTLAESMAQEEGQIRTLRENIIANDREREKCLAMANEARKSPNTKQAFQLNSRQAARLEEANKSLTDLHDRLVDVNKTIRNMYEAADYVVQDLDQAIKLAKRQQKALLAGYNAFKAARAILDGGSDEREVYNLALENLADDYGQKMGEIENFVKMSQGFLQGVNLQNGVYEQQALDVFAAWDKRSEELKQQSGGPNALTEAPPNQMALLTTQGEFADLLAAPKNERR